MTQAPRKRGPRKGDGGRPAYKIHDDPDRWIIVTALWLRDDPKDHRSFAVLQMLDYLLTPHNSIEVERGSRMVDEVEYGCLSLTNTEPPREPSSNCPPDRQALSAPGRRAFRHSRLKHLQEKVGFYQRAKLSEREARFYSLTQLGLDFIVGGRREAGPVLKMLGWEMTAMARQRLADILRPGGSITPRPDASID